MKRFDFRPELFPITLEALHVNTRAVVWSQTIERPEDAALVYIPPLRIQLGHPVAMRIRFGDGSVEEEREPPAFTLPTHCARKANGGAARDD
jgi:hypothetical protein